MIHVGYNESWVINVHVDDLVHRTRASASTVLTNTQLTYMSFQLFQG